MQEPISSTDSLRDKIKSLRAVAEAAYPAPWVVPEYNKAKPARLRACYVEVPIDFSPVQVWPDINAGLREAQFIATARNEFLPLLDALSVAVEAINVMAEANIIDWYTPERDAGKARHTRNALEARAKEALTRVTALLGEKR